MNGTELAKTFNKFETGAPLSDAELTYLVDGLQSLVDFFSETKVQPMVSYYARQQYTAQQIIWYRKNM